MKKTILFTLSSIIILVIIAVVYYNPFKDKMFISGEVPFKDQTTLIGESNVILTGIVKEILPSEWSTSSIVEGSTQRKVLQTDVIIKINEVHKGALNGKDNVRIRLDYGETSKVEVVSEGYPTYKVGNEVLVFLSRDDSDVAKPDEDYYVLTGMSQGNFKLIEKTDADQIFSNNRDTIKLSNIKEKLNKALEEYRTRPKMVDPKLHQP